MKLVYAVVAIFCLLNAIENNMAASNEDKVFEECRRIQNITDDEWNSISDSFEEEQEEEEEPEEQPVDDDEQTNDEETANEENDSHDYQYDSSENEAGAWTDADDDYDEAIFRNVDRKYKCLMHCFIEQMGYYNDEGRLNAEKLMEDGEVDKDEYELVKDCKAKYDYEYDFEECDYAFKVTYCVKKFTE